MAIISCAVRPTDLDTTSMPKALLPIAGKPLIKHAILQVIRGGVRLIVLIVGFHGQLVKDMILSSEEFTGVSIDIVDLGDAWRAGYCPSLIAAEHAVTEDEFLICTFDHLFHAGLITRVLEEPIAASGACVLADWDDVHGNLATDPVRLKIVGDEHSVTQVLVPKEDANGLEAGLFKASRSIFEVIKDIAKEKPYFRFCEVLSELAQRGNLRAVGTGGLAWVSVENEAQLSRARDLALKGELDFLTQGGKPELTGTRRAFVPPVSSDPQAIDRLPQRTKLISLGGREEERKVTICLVGLGRAGQFHLKSISMLTNKVKLLWVVDVDEELIAKVANAYDCKGTTNLNVPLADTEVDAVIIASTTFLHYEHIMRALKAGKAVLAEKPISHDPAELLHVIDTALDNKLPFMAGYQRRGDKNFRALKAEMKAGHIGGTRVIKCCSR